MEMPSLPRTRTGRIVLGAVALGLAAAAGGATGALANDPWIRPTGHGWIGTVDGHPWEGRLAGTDGHPWIGSAGDGDPWGCC